MRLQVIQILEHGSTQLEEKSLWMKFFLLNLVVELPRAQELGMEVERKEIRLQLNQWLNKIKKMNHINKLKALELLLMALELLLMALELLLMALEPQKRALAPMKALEHTMQKKTNPLISLLKNHLLALEQQLELVQLKNKINNNSHVHSKDNNPREHRKGLQNALPRWIFQKFQMTSLQCHQ
jgi:hypothetical protein